jgi:acetyl esterase/lipase
VRSTYGGVGCEEPGFADHRSERPLSSWFHTPRLPRPGSGSAGGDVPRYASPALETNLSELPPTTTFVGELDPFLDETVAYVEGLGRAGIPVEFRRYPRCFHGFDAIRPGAKVSRAANEFVCERFASAVDRDFAKQS